MPTPESQLGPVYEEMGRKLLPWLIGIAMSLGALVGSQVLIQQSEMGKSLAVVQTDIAVIKTNLEYLKARNELARSSNR